MATLNLDTSELKNKSIILEGNSPLTDAHKEILKKFEVIYIGRDFNQSLGGLPSCIKAIKYNRHDDFYHKWMSYNKKLVNYGTMVYKDFAFNQPLNNLHYGLEYLELYGKNYQELRNLPASLKILLINWQCRITLEYLPESLEILYLSSIQLTYEGQTHLPQGLTELYLNGGVNGTICCLPVRLKVLYLNGINTQLDKFIKLPEELHTFIFYDSEWRKENKHIIKWLFKNKKMPKSLKKCIFPVHYVDIFIELKEYAREYIDVEIDWKFVDIIPDNLVEHVKAIYN
jgi:hypothetical protein